MKTIAYFYLTPDGEKLARRLAAARPGDLYGKESFRDQLKKAFFAYDYLVCIMATGIVVRTLAEVLVHKTCDPGVVVLDQKGSFAISLLSGHLGGANELAREMAAISGGQAVITTATDVEGKLSFDTFAKKYDMAIENIGTLKYISGALLAGHKILVVSDVSYPEVEKEKTLLKMISKQDLTPLDSTCMEAIAGSDQRKEDKISVFKMKDYALEGDEYKAIVVIDEGLRLSDSKERPVLYLRPRTIYAGIGCKRNMEAGPITESLSRVLLEEGIHPLSLKSIATIPLKADEPGIIETAKTFGVPLTIVSTEEIDQLDIEALGIKTSDFVASQTGVLSVSTASSYLASGRGRILRDKAKFKGITVALCKKG